MPIIYFGGDPEGEQARGADYTNLTMQLFAIRRDDPLNMISIGGHRIDDAPTYNTTDAKLLNRYVHKQGQNRVEEVEIASEVIKSVSFNLALPHRFVSVTDRLFQNQAQCKYDVVFIPDDCASGCDAFWLLGVDARFGSKQIQNSILGFDENAEPINVQRTLRTSGQLLGYNGLNIEFLTAAGAGVYDVTFWGDRCDAGCGCPYQGVAYAGDGIAGASDDGGANWQAIDVTAVEADLIGHNNTAIVYAGGKLIGGYSDVVGGIGADGGIWTSSYTGGVWQPAVLATLDVASTGIQAIVVTALKIYAFGTAGQMYVSCNGGLDWTLVTVPATMSAQPVLDVAYDRINDLIFIAQANAVAHIFNVATGVFTDITALVNGTAATDLTSVAVTAPSSVAFGAADGNVYENFTADVETSAYTNTESFGAGLTVGALAGDGYGYRVLAGVDVNLQERNVYHEQEFEALGSALVGNVTVLRAGEALLDEGVNFFLGASDTGEIFTATQCGLCVEAEC